MDGRQWRYRVVKRMRGRQGQWFDYWTAATFVRASDAADYAEDLAREQSAAGVRGVRIDVRTRRQPRTVVTYRIG